MLKQIKRTSVAIKQRRQGLEHKIQDLFVKVYIGGRTGMQNIETEGLLKESGSIKPWIFDPTAASAVDRAVDTAHGSTMDQPP
jgi:hypothetical protein